jgi:hypothetical protein
MGREAFHLLYMDWEGLVSCYRGNCFLQDGLPEACALARCETGVTGVECPNHQGGCTWECRPQSLNLSSDFGFLD